MLETIKPQLQALFFDLDGTLIDTDDQAAARIAGRLHPFLGQRAPRAARWLLMKAETPGNAFITALDMLHLDDDLFAFGRQFRKNAPHKPFQLIPGVEEMIVALRAHYRIALVTTRGQESIAQFLAQYPRIQECVETTCGLEDTPRLKPHPAPVLLAAERLKLPLKACMMIGDTTLDVLAGKRAGAWTTAVLCGFGELKELRRAGADVVLKSTADLQEALRVDS